tara:strand:- start:1435 stop:1812 length:378 start_codon:yes stop_codon:yes gene_type:complete
VSLYNMEESKYPIPTHDPTTGELNPRYEELTGKPNPLLEKKDYSMDNKFQELLTITMEECGELIQECSKAIRKDQYHANKELIREVGDVLCMIRLLYKYDIITWHEVEEQILIKEDRLKRWSSLL